LNRTNNAISALSVDLYSHFNLFLPSIFRKKDDFPQYENSGISDPGSREEIEVAKEVEKEETVEEKAGWCERLSCFCVRGGGGERD
jgi:hypothetical protein